MTGIVQIPTQPAGTVDLTIAVIDGVLHTGLSGPRGATAVALPVLSQYNSVVDNFIIIFSLSYNNDRKRIHH